MCLIFTLKCTGNPFKLIKTRRSERERERDDRHSFLGPHNHHQKQNGKPTGSFRYLKSSMEVNFTLYLILKRDKNSFRLITKIFSYKILRQFIFLCHLPYARRIILFDTILSTCYPLVIYSAPLSKHFQYYVFKREFNDIDKVWKWRTHSRKRPYEIFFSVHS